MNKQIRELTLAAMFLALSIALSIIQIPLVPQMGLSLDFSYAAILIGRRYIGFTKTLIIAMLFPWFTMMGLSTGGYIGALFLFLQSIFVVVIDYLLMRNKVSVVRIIIAVFLITAWSALLNVFIIGPMWGGGFDNYYDNFWNYSNSTTVDPNSSGPLVWLIVSILFNPIKFMVVYIAVYWLLPKLIKEGVDYA